MTHKYKKYVSRKVTDENYTKIMEQVGKWIKARKKDKESRR